MLLDTTPVTGPSKRSYAQVVKEAPSMALGNATASSSSHDEEDWTDVSSVTSCDWPDSVDEQCTLLNLKCHLSHHDLTNLSTLAVSPDEENSPDRRRNRHPGVRSIDDVLWIDDAVDTRAPQAMAGHIKFRNRTRWLYTYNIYLVPEFELKLWERFPGTVAVSKPVLHNMTDRLFRKCGSGPSFAAEGVEP